MKAWLSKWFPIDRPSPRSPFRQVVDHVLGGVWLVVMVPAVMLVKRGG